MESLIIALGVLILESNPSANIFYSVLSHESVNEKEHYGSHKEFRKVLHLQFSSCTIMQQEHKLRKIQSGEIWKVPDKRTQDKRTTILRATVT